MSIVIICYSGYALLSTILACLLYTGISHILANGRIERIVSRYPNRNIIRLHYYQHGRLDIQNPHENRFQKANHRPSNMSATSPRSTASQSILPPLAYTLSYEEMLTCEKNGIRSRILSI